MALWISRLPLSGRPGHRRGGADRAVIAARDRTFFVVIGALSPGDHPWVTVGAIGLVVLLAVRLVRVSRAMHDHAHDEEMRELHKLRETRGF